MATLANDAAHDMLTSLRRELLGSVALPSALVSYLVLLLVDVAFGIRSLLVPTAGACLVIGSLAAYRLRRNQPRLAALVYVAGLAAAVLTVVWASYNPFATAAYPAIILAAMATIGGRAIVPTTVVGAAVVLAAARRHGQLDATVLIPLAVLAFSALLAWLSNRGLATAVEWAWNSYRQARASAEEARDRRAELARTLKALDEAYGRLERFSAQLAQAREAAEESRRAKLQFVATVSHELRTPLNIIIGFAELMSLSPESYGVRRAPRQFMGDVNRIYRSAEHLKSLIDDVLDLSQIDARHMVLLTELATPSDVIREATDMIWGLATQKGLKLSLDVPPDLPPIPLDRLRIRQVLLNLLSNAVRFCDRGEVTISARLVGAEVMVTVADTGPGIARGDLERVFEEFRQLDSSLSRRYPGTGLGLALSRRFVELHGGRMWVESELGHGSRFHFTIPLAASRERVDPRATAWPIPPSVQAKARRTVLVAGAEPMVVNLLKRHLQGYDVQGVPEADLNAAIESAMPHAVVANGLHTHAHGGQSLPVPLISCPLPDPALLEARLGVDHYLTKPVTRERLLELLDGYGPAVRRVLVVDDDKQMAQLLARIVRSAPGGYDVQVACGGEEGWARMQEWPPDLVLLDLVMAGLDGLGVLALMRADERLRHAHVAMVTAHDLPDVESRLPTRRTVEVEAPERPTVTEVLRYLQAILDVLPSPRAPASPPPKPAGARPG